MPPGDGCAAAQAAGQETRRKPLTPCPERATHTEAVFGEQFRHNAFFIGPNTREAVAEGRADYAPLFLSEIPGLFRRGRVPVDVALIQVSRPDGPEAAA